MNTITTSRIGVPPWGAPESAYRGPCRILWAHVTVDDPQFVTQPFVTSSHFKTLADGSSWKPVACTAR